MKPFLTTPVIRCFSAWLLCTFWVLPLHAETNSQLVQDSIVLTHDRLVYKDKSAKIPFTRDALIKVFGKPSREIYNTAGTMVIWDEVGLTCFGCQDRGTPEEYEFLTPEEKEQHVRQDYVDAISLFVRKHNPYPEKENEYAHEPGYPFPGRLVLDGVDIDGVTSFDRFLKLRKGKQTILLPENSFSFYIRCEPSPHEITLHTIRDKYDEDFMTIYSVSIRNVEHFYRQVECAEVFSSTNKAPAGK